MGGPYQVLEWGEGGGGGGVVGVGGRGGGGCRGGWEMSGAANTLP